MIPADPTGMPDDAAPPSGMPKVRFRDPPPVEVEADALAAEIAGVLVRAPHLPVELPRFGFSLIGVRAVRRRIELLFGFDAPIASLVLREARGDRASGEVVSVELVELHHAAARHREQLRTMAARVGAAVDEDRWRRARALADRLALLPVGVPMDYHRQVVAGIGDMVGLVRVGFRCNQDCGMCWQGREWGNFGGAQVRTWIEDLAEAGARDLILSGGEPTLDRDLPEYVALARRLGFDRVTIESNAIRCADPAYAATLRDAGLTSAFVSLHSSNPEVSDAITRAPGTHVRTVAGILGLLDAGISVKINAVMTQQGLDDLASLPDFVATTFGHHRALLDGVMFSYPTEPFDRELFAEVLPDPVKLRDVLRHTLDRALALDLRPHGLDGPCGPALCAFGADPRITSLTPVPEQLDFRTHPAPCDACAVRYACFGVRHADYAIYGDAAVQPITLP